MPHTTPSARPCWAGCTTGDHVRACGHTPLPALWRKAADIGKRQLVDCRDRRASAVGSLARFDIGTASVPIPKFASLRGTLVCELRNQGDTSNLWFLRFFGF